MEDYCEIDPALRACNDLLAEMDKADAQPNAETGHEPAATAAGQQPTENNVSVRVLDYVFA